MAFASRSRKPRGRPVKVNSHNSFGKQSNHSIIYSDPTSLQNPSVPTFLEDGQMAVLSPTQKLLAPEIRDEQLVKFNISGVHYTVSKRMLGRIVYPSTEEETNSPEETVFRGEIICILSRFADESLTQSELIALADGYFPDTKEFFFERSPIVFESVLQFYRTGKFHAPPGVCTEMLLDELRYWRLSLNAILCCPEENALGRLFKAPLYPQNPVCCSPIVPQSPKEPPGYCRIKMDGVSGSNGDIGKCEEEEPDQFEGICLGNTRRAIWNFMEEPTTSKPAKIFSLVSVAVVLISVLDLIIASLQDFQVQGPRHEEPKPHWFLLYIEYACIVWFTLEYVVRLVIVSKRLQFIKTPLNIIDCLSVLPFYVELCMELANIRTENLDNVKGALLVLRILRVLRVARIFKLAKYSGGLQSFGHTLKASYKEIWMLVLFMSITIVLFSTTVYFLEKDMENTKFTSIPATFWWCIVTMTTVGYGDMTPHTLGGKLVASLTSVSGVIVLAFPITIIVENFNKYYRADDIHDSAEEDDVELLHHADKKISNV